MKVNSQKPKNNSNFTEHDVLEPEETVVPEGTDVTIKCETLSEQAEIVWCKDMSLVLLNERFAAHSSADQRQHYLRLKNVSADDSGEYGVLIDETYLPVTKISVQKGAIFVLTK